MFPKRFYGCVWPPTVGRGCDVFGFEYSKAALEYCRERKLAVAKFDPEKDVFSDVRTFDVAAGMEVAEHLPATVAVIFRAEQR